MPPSEPLQPPLVFCLRSCAVCLKTLGSGAAPRSGPACADQSHTSGASKALVDFGTACLRVQMTFVLAVTREGTSCNAKHDEL